MSGPSEGYLAFALSHDQWMGGDDAYLCINEDHSVHVSTAYLKGRSPPVLDSENSLEDVSWRLVDGVLQCSFRRSIRLPAYKGRFNLDASYYIFLADGETSEVVTVFLGMDLPALDLPDPWDTYTMIGFVAWHVGIDVLLEIHSYCLIRKVEVIEDDRVQILQSLTSAEAEGRLFNQIVLTIYVCGNIVFLIAFLAAINQI
ncbi:ferric-chelate reductase 1 [Grus japonensis]|uniref:Ferric-chelate reductase 1 n=1 Tax=Grus japonensis TaxID=30415 RepID=A0ABC9X5T5_GRUJA